MSSGRPGGGEERPSAPGWYPDPWSATGQGERYFDGREWGSTERPLARHAATPPDRAGRSTRRTRRVIGLLLVVAVAAVGVVVLRSRKSDTKVAATSPSPTHVTPSTVGAPSTSANATGDGRSRPGCGQYCAYSLTGDWAELQQGDCANVRTDTSAKTFAFTRLSCSTRHDSEIYFAQRPDPVSSLDPPPSSIADLISRVCGPEVLRNYAARYASAQPNAVAEAGTWGDGTERVCAVRPDNPTQPIART